MIMQYTRRPLAHFNTALQQPAESAPVAEGASASMREDSQRSSKRLPLPQGDLIGYTPGTLGPFGHRPVALGCCHGTLRFECCTPLPSFVLPNSFPESCIDQATDTP